MDGITWQLFLDDETNIYLIASDFVPNNKLPCYGNSGYTETDLLKISGSDYCARFCTNIYRDGVYTNGSPYLDFNNAPSLLSTSKSYPIINKYLRWLQNDYNLAGYIRSITAIAYMMDTEKWSNFARNDDRIIRNWRSDIRNVYSII